MKKTNDILIILMIIVNTICMLLSICGKYNSNILVCLSLYLIIFLPRIVRKFSSKVNDLIEPKWLIKKTILLNDIDKEMKKRDTYQGRLFTN